MDLHLTGKSNTRNNYLGLVTNSLLRFSSTGVPSTAHLAWLCVTEYNALQEVLFIPLLGLSLVIRC